MLDISSYQALFILEPFTSSVSVQKYLNKELKHFYFFLNFKS